MRSIVFTLPTVIALAGCHTLSHETAKPMEIIVRDAETHQPIPQADVRVSNGLMAWTTAKTGDAGTAAFPKTPPDDGGLVAEVSSKGYLSELQNVYAEEVQAHTKSNPTESPIHVHANTVVELYAEPRPKIDLILPAGYRGRIAVDIDVPTLEAGSASGVRNFTVTLGNDGNGHLVGSAILHHVAPTDFQPRYADGSALPTVSNDGDSGFRWVKSTDHTIYFVIGTKYDLNEYRKSIDGMPERSGPSGDDGKKKGGGRGGKRGGRH